MQTPPPTLLIGSVLDLTPAVGTVRFETANRSTWTLPQVGWGIVVTDAEPDDAGGVHIETSVLPIVLDSDGHPATPQDISDQYERPVSWSVLS